MAGTNKNSKAQDIFDSADIETDGFEYSIDFDITIASDQFDANVKFHDGQFFVTKCDLKTKIDFTDLEQLKELIRDHVSKNFDLSKLYDKIGGALSEAGDDLAKWV